MMEWYNNLSGLQPAFFYCAVIGGVIFAIKFVLMMIGADADVDFDIDSGDADGGMMWISTFSLAAFFMMFGLGGLTTSLQFKQGSFVSFVCAIVVGMTMMFLLQFLRKKMNALQTDGTCDINNAIGAEGSVYLTIPASGQGKVQLIIQGSQKVLAAISENGSEIKTGEIVTVTGIVNNILKVTKQK